MQDIEIPDYRLILENGKPITIPNCKNCGAGCFKIDGFWTCIICKRIYLESGKCKRYKRT